MMPVQVLGGNRLPLASRQMFHLTEDVDPWACLCSAFRTTKLATELFMVSSTRLWSTHHHLELCGGRLALLRYVNAIHANTALKGLPDAVRSAVASSVRDSFAKLQKDGYVVAEAKSVKIKPARQDIRTSGGGPGLGHVHGNTRPREGRPRPSRG
jgi:hypothetical protein